VNDGLFAVDNQGVVLPHDDFSTADARQYPRIAGIRTSPLGPVGSPWRDAEVTGAAQVAAALRHDWAKLRLARISPGGFIGAGRTSDTQFNLTTHRGTTIHWGRAPGAARVGELSAGEKLAQLLELVARYQSLDDVPKSAQPIDLRPSADRAAEAPAIQPLPLSPSEAEEAAQEGRPDEP
jgi:hypothetical protein